MLEASAIKKNHSISAKKTNTVANTKNVDIVVY